MKVGNDVQSISALRAKPTLLRNRAVFTTYEVAYCAARHDPSASFAGLLCAKEACIKALSGFVGVPAFSFLDIEVRHDPSGRPRLCPRGALLAWMTAGSVTMDLSISHSGDYASAIVVANQVPAPAACVARRSA